MRQLEWLAVVLTVVLPLGGCAAATLGQTITRIQPFYREQGMDPPSSSDQATVYVDFRDQTVTNGANQFKRKLALKFMRVAE